MNDGRQYNTFPRRRTFHEFGRPSTRDFLDYQGQTPFNRPPPGFPAFAPATGRQPAAFSDNRYAAGYSAATSRRDVQFGRSSAKPHDAGSGIRSEPATAMTTPRGSAFTLWSTGRDHPGLAEDSPQHEDGGTPPEEAALRPRGDSHSARDMGSPSELNFDCLRLITPPPPDGGVKNAAEGGWGTIGGATPGTRDTTPQRGHLISTLRFDEDMTISDEDLEESSDCLGAHPAEKAIGGDCIVMGQGGKSDRDIPLKTDRAESVVGQDAARKMSRVGSIVGHGAVPGRNVAPNKTRKRFVIMCALLTLVALSGFLYSGVLFSDNCGSTWHLDEDQLRNDLDLHMFGQHIAVSLVLRTVHLLATSVDHNVSVLSFQGWTGVGKNHMSTILARRFPPRHVHKLIIPLHFAHSSQPERDEAAIFEWITSNLTACQWNLFIVDELDHLSPAGLKGLSAAITHLKHKPPNDAKVLILLLSNSAASLINRILAEQLLSAGRPREDLTQGYVVAALRRHHEQVTTPAARVTTPAERPWYLRMHDESLVDHIVPFLPLEKAHVTLCIRRYVRQLGMLDDSNHGNSQAGRKLLTTLIPEVIQQMRFFPEEQQLFSKTGCRTVSAHVDFAINSDY